MGKRNHTQNKIFLDKMDKDLGGVKIIQDWKDLATHNKTYETLNFVCEKMENAIRDGNMDKAEMWLERVSVRLSKIKVKHPISVGEFSAYLNDKDKVLKFVRGLGKMTKALAEVAKYEGVITKSITALKSLSNLYKTTPQQGYKKAVTKLQQDRDKLQEGYEKMKVLLNCLDVVNEASPAGIQQMIEFSIEVFKGAGGTIKKVNNYAAEIEKWTKEGPDKLNEETGNNKINASKSHMFVDKFKRAHKDLDINELLDTNLGRPR